MAFLHRLTYLSGFVVSVLSLVPQSLAEEVSVWIGTETRPGGSQGIYHTQLDLQSGKLSSPRLAAKVQNPGFVALHPTLPVLYSTARHDGAPTVAAFSIEQRDSANELAVTSQVPTGGGGATHVSTDSRGRFLLSAQYGGGTVASYALNGDGTLDRRVSLIQHEGGSGVVNGRQEAPHPHWIGTSPDDRFVFVPDLGLDQVVIYRLNQDTGELIPHGHAKSPPGGGPRHMKFTRDGKFAYVLNELALSLTVFAYDAAAGTLTEIETVPTISAADKAHERFVSAAEIRIHPNQQFVYASNRGHDTITVFRRDADTGRLAVVEIEPIRGATPRNFNIDPTGQWLVAAGQESNTLAVFAVDGETGELTFARVVVNVPRPICVEFGPR